MLIIPKILKENVALMTEFVGDQLNTFSKILEKTINFSSNWQLLKKEDSLDRRMNNRQDKDSRSICRLRDFGFRKEI